MSIFKWSVPEKVQNDAELQKICKFFENFLNSYGFVCSADTSFLRKKQKISFEMVIITKYAGNSYIYEIVLSPLDKSYGNFKMHLPNICYGDKTICKLINDNHAKCKLTRNGGRNNGSSLNYYNITLTK